MLRGEEGQSIVTAFSVFQPGHMWIPAATGRGPLHASLAEEAERGVPGTILNVLYVPGMGHVIYVPFTQRSEIS